MKLRVLALLVLAFPLSGHAQRLAQLSGAGTVGCGTYLENRRLETPPEWATSWVWGYISAYNFFSSYQQISAPDRSTLLAYLDKFCRDHPLDPLAVGTNRLIGDLGGWRPKAQKSP